MALNLLLAESDITALVPDCYASFRPIVAEALGFFLEHLSPQRLESILATQLSLPSDAQISTRLVHFMHACPAPHKLGQVIARNRRLDPDLRRRLQRLESIEPRTPLGLIRPIIERELAPVRDRYSIEVPDAALAEASVAVVVPCTRFSSPESNRTWTKI